MQDPRIEKLRILKGRTSKFNKFFKISLALMYNMLKKLNLRIISFRFAVYR